MRALGRLTCRGLVCATLGIAFAALVPRTTAAQAQDPIAVIVSPDNALTEISIEDLRRLFLGQVTMMPSREPVILIETSALRDRFYHAALGMTSSRFKRHWIGLVFSGESGSPPKEVGSSEEVQRFVASNRGAIAFVSARSVGSGIKVLTVQGQRPTNPGYLLR